MSVLATIQIVRLGTNDLYPAMPWLRSKLTRKRYRKRSRQWERRLPNIYLRRRSEILADMERLYKLQINPRIRRIVFGSIIPRHQPDECRVSG